MVDYKKYSLEKLEEWMHDAMSAGEASPQEIFDVIKGVVEENYHYHKHHTSQAYELLALLNGDEKDYTPSSTDPADNDLSDVDGLYMTQFYCDSNDPSEQCKGSWNDFWEDDTTKVDGYSVNGQSHSDYWYDYDRNDPNRQNPFEDKVVKWQLPVQVDDAAGDAEPVYYVNFPDDLLEAANLKEGDTVEWVDNKNGTYTLKKTK